MIESPFGEWSAVQWRRRAVGAQTGRRGHAGPVRRLLGGTASPAALVVRFQGSWSADDSALLQGRDARSSGSFLVGLQVGQQLPEIRPRAQRLQVGVRFHLSDAGSGLEIS